MRRRAPHLRRASHALLVALVITAGTIGGMTIGLLAGTSDVERTSIGTIETSVRPDIDGHVTVYVPLVDWRVELLDHDAPVTVRMELRGIDRAQAGEGLSSPSAAARSLDDVRADVERIIERSLRRAAVAAGIGGLIGSMIAGAVLAGVLLRRRWLLLAPLLGISIGVLVLVPSIQQLQRLDDQHLEVVAAGGHASELPVVLRFAEQLLDVGDEYRGHYDTALRSLANAAAFAGQDRGRIDSTALLISDLHDNIFVLESLEQYLEDETVFAVGDFMQVGARIEQQTAARVAGLGDRVVAISGNHDTPEYMRALAAAGADVLDAEQATTNVEGLSVAGYPDPLERDEDSGGAHRLRVYGAEYAAQQDAFVAWWDALPERPDVVLVHQHGFAHHLVEHLEEAGDDEPLVILTGHDHEPHVHASGPHVIIDGGSVGAGGFAAIGEQPASFARLSIGGGRIAAVDLVSIEPLTGRASSERIDLPDPSSD